MRPFWYRIAVLTAVLTISFVMLIINIGFEVAGSTPDYSEFGFLAGSIPSFFILYPASSFVVVYLLRRFVLKHLDLGIRSGSVIGFIGSLIYFGMGLLNLMFEPTYPTFSVYGVEILILLSVACTFGGAVGSIWNQRSQLKAILS